MDEISVSEVQQKREQGEDFILLDVREDVELSIARIEGVLHIPMGQVPEKLDEIGRDKQIVVFCHKGGRSAKVAEFLETQGISNVMNMTGGIQAWSEEIDPDVPMY